MIQERSLIGFAARRFHSGSNISTSNANNRAKDIFSFSSIGSEQFKTWVAHFPRLCNGRTGMQWATLGKSGSEAASQLQGRIGRAFSSNSMVNTMDMTTTIQYILTAAQSLGSRVYNKKSCMTIRGLAGVLFCKNEQA